MVRSRDTISATVLTNRRGSAYWNLRTNGDSLLSRRLPEASGSLQRSALEFAEAVADTLACLRRLYANLGITPRADLRIKIRFPMMHQHIIYEGFPTQNDWPGGVHLEEVVLGRIEHELLSLTRHFAEPILMSMFQGSRLEDEAYERIVADVRASAS